MTKIEEFEKRIIYTGLSDDDFAEYEKLLRRVHDNFLKLQHCYITAIKFSENRADSAVALIEWGLDKFPSTWSPTYSALDYIGRIRERNGQYRLAYEAYLRAADVLGEDHLSYSITLSGSLMWMLLHIDNFTYSKQLEDYYNAFNCIDDFEKAFASSTDNQTTKGFEMIYKSLKGAVEELGIEEIESLNQEFNPEFHDCISKVKAEKKNQAGLVSRVFVKGYKYRGEDGKVIRHSVVEIYE